MCFLTCLSWRGCFVSQFWWLFFLFMFSWFSCFTHEWVGYIVSWSFSKGSVLIWYTIRSLHIVIYSENSDQILKAFPMFDFLPDRHLPSKMDNAAYLKVKQSEKLLMKRVVARLVETQVLSRIATMLQKCARWNQAVSGVKWYQNNNVSLKEKRHEMLNNLNPLSGYCIVIKVWL